MHVKVGVGKENDKIDGGKSMHNNWRRPPRSEIWRELQALALWILIIGVVGYSLFPNFFKNIYSRLSEPVSQTSTLNDNYTLNNTTSTNSDGTNSQAAIGQGFSSVSNALYNGNSEVSSGYWIIFVSSGEFKQLAVSSEAYAFLLRIIESDQGAAGKNTVILAANGQIQKYSVSEEVYSIISNMEIIGARVKGTN